MAVARHITTPLSEPSRYRDRGERGLFAAVILRQVMDARREGTVADLKAWLTSEDGRLCASLAGVEANDAMIRRAIATVQGAAPKGKLAGRAGQWA